MADHLDVNLAAPMAHYSRAATKVGTMAPQRVVSMADPRAVRTAAQKVDSRAVRLARSSVVYLVVYSAAKMAHC